MATLTADTVSNILQIISDLRGESTLNTDAARIRAVSRGERDYAKRRFWRTHLRSQVSDLTGDGSTKNFTIGSAAYPMRLKGLSEVFVGGTTEDKRHEIVDYFKYLNEYNKNNSARLVYEWYDAANDAWKMHVNPAPADGDTIYYSYFWEPPKRTLTTESVVCPNMDIIARLGNAYIYEGEDEEKYKEQLQIAESLISEYEGLEDAPAVNQLYTMGAIENAQKARGIGAY